MAYKMINDYILIKQHKAEQKSRFILTNVEPPCIGTVISVGPGRMMDSGVMEEHDIEVGDNVVFGKSSLNMPLHDDESGEDYFVMKISDIFGKKK